MAISKREQIILEIIGETLVENVQLQLAIIEGTGKPRSKPGLKDSQIYQSVDYQITKDGGVQLLIAPYYQFIESGRKPNVTRVPFAALLKWVLKKKLRFRNKKGQFTKGSVNALVFAIRESIYKNGIKPRPFLDQALEKTAKELPDAVTIELEELITEKIKYVLG